MDDYHAKGSVTDSPAPEMPLSRQLRVDTDPVTGAVTVVDQLSDHPAGDTPQVTSLTVVAAQGVDISNDVAIKLAILKVLGAGILTITGYSPATMAQQMLVTGDNIRVHLDVDIAYTGTKAPPAAGSPAEGVICFRGTTTHYLQGVALTASRRVKVSCNGAAITYAPVAGVAYAGVMFSMCERPVWLNVDSEGSVYYGGVLHYAPGAVVENVEASNVLNENGIQVVGNAEHIRPYSAIDPATWSGAKLINCTARACRNHGIGTWGGVAVTLVNPTVIGCGNNDGTAIAGPAGGINLEYDQNADPTAARNYAMTVINPTVVNSFGFGLRTNGQGMKVIGGRVVGTKKPTAYTDGSPALWGSAAFAQNAGTIDLQGTLIDGSELYGIRLQGNATQFPKVRVSGGEIRGCVDRAVYGIGYSLIEISPDTSIHDNGTVAGGAVTVDCNNAPFNTNAGTLRLAGRFDANGGIVAQVAAAGEVDISGVRGHNNAANLAAANHAIYVTSCQRLKAADIQLSSTNAKQARVLKCDGSVQAIIDRKSILGDQTNATAPRADVVATTLVGDLVLTAAPATAPSYLWQQAIDTTNGKVYIAKGQASAADWLLLN